MQNGWHRNDLLSGFDCKNRKYPFRVHTISTTILPKKFRAATANPSVIVKSIRFTVYLLENLSPCASIWHRLFVSLQRQIHHTHGKPNRHIPNR
jgi:hypothetical protein